MAFCRLSGLPVVEARIALPRVGAWVADVRLEEDTALPDSAILEAGDAMALMGAVRRSGSVAGTTRARLVGGGGGLTRRLEPKQYQDCELSLPLSEILSGVGETLSPTSDSVLLSRHLRHWVLAGCTAATALAALLQDVDAAWRILPDGTVWVGAETWPAAGGEAELIGENPSAGFFELASVAPSLLPGTTLAGRQVSYVEHRFNARELRTSVWLEDEDG